MVLCPGGDRAHDGLTAPDDKQRSPRRRAPPDVERERDQPPAPQVVADEVLGHVPPTPPAGRSPLVGPRDPPPATSWEKRRRGPRPPIRTRGGVAPERS